MRFVAMPSSAFRTLSQRRFAWLLWLVLLLPVAQFAASWHAVSHAAPDARDTQHAPHLTHCDLCLASAAIGSGAPADQPAAVVLESLRHALPQAALYAVWVAAPAKGYLSRAPPFVSR
jgi:hypothetical protein